MLDLLRCRRVCEAWNANIEESTKLQKKLFLIPDGEALSSIDEDPRLRFDKDAIGPLRPTLNPLLRRIFEDLGYQDVDNCGRNAKVTSRKAAAGYAKIWKKMLLSQPPVQQYVTRIRWFEYDEDSGAETMLLRNATGLTLGNVTSAVEEAIHRAGDDLWERNDTYCTIALEGFDVECNDLGDYGDS